MSKILKNVTLSPIFVSDTGITIPASSQYTIPPQDYLLWAASSDIVTYVGASQIVVNDGSVDLSISDGIDLIKGIFPSNVIVNPGNISVEYGEVSSVASGVLTTILSYTVVNDVYLKSVDVSGTNIAKYQVLLNGNPLDTAYTNHGSPLSHSFSFSEGLLIVTSDVLLIKVLHNRPTTGDFNAKAILLEV